MEQSQATKWLAQQEDVRLYKIEETIQVKLDKGLPLSSAEFGRLATQLAMAVKSLEKELNELKVSISRSRLDPDNEGMGSTSKLRSKPN